MTLSRNALRAMGSILFLAAVGIGSTASGKEPVDEDRYLSLLAELRCPKCQHVNLLASSAPIAADLQVAVRRLMEEGKTDREIKRYLQERYGDYVLYDPPFRFSTLLLWLLPVLFAAVGAGVVFRFGRRGAHHLSDLTFEDAEQEDDAATGGAS